MDAKQKEHMKEVFENSVKFLVKHAEAISDVVATVKPSPETIALSKILDQVNSRVNKEEKK